MTSSDFKQVLTFLSTEYIFFIKKNDQVDEYIAIERIDELRKLHQVYKKECDNYTVYPHLNLEKLNLYKLEIEKVCKEYGIEVLFSGNKTLEYKKGIHAHYFYKQQKIDNLIIFNNAKK